MPNRSSLNSDFSLMVSQWDVPTMAEIVVFLYRRVLTLTMLWSHFYEEKNLICLIPMFIFLMFSVWLYILCSYRNKEISSLPFCLRLLPPEKPWHFSLKVMGKLRPHLESSVRPIDPACPPPRRDLLDSKVALLTCSEAVCNWPQPSLTAHIVDIFKAETKTKMEKKICFWQTTKTANEYFLGPVIKIVHFVVKTSN